VRPAELRDHARQEADELGPEPSGREGELWREERWGAVVLLAGLADDDAPSPTTPRLASRPSHGPGQRHGQGGGVAMGNRMVALSRLPTSARVVC